jgi:hypothetical protein
MSVSEAVVHGGLPGSSQAISEEEKHCKNCIRHRTNEKYSALVYIKTAFVG